jgi:predicted ATPase
LQKVAGLSEDDLYAALEEASERAIVEQVPSSTGVAFRFTHAMFRTLLYEEIFAPRRIRLHQQVGRALEEVHVRRLEEHAPELAEHFSQSTEASDLEKAVRYGELAAQRAMGVYAYSEAVRHLEQALRAQEVLDADDKAKCCDLLLALGGALVLSGEPLRAASAVAEDAFAIAAVTDAPVRTPLPSWHAAAGHLRSYPFMGRGP